MEYIEITNNNREAVNKFIIDHWYTTKMVVHGRVLDMAEAYGIVAMDNNEIIGLLTYITYDNICEIVSLDSMRENMGIGTELINKVIKKAKEIKCRRIDVITTNDNINAIKFYQKRGFDMAVIYHNAVNEARKIKPEIPLIGDNEIPIKHEIKFEFEIK